MSSGHRVNNTRARQNINKENALMLAKVGVAVFPSSGKTPLIPLYNRLDTDISAEDRNAAILRYREEHDKSPIHVGCTRDPETVKRMWRAFRDAVPSIATGPSGLVVLDADAKDDGPEKMNALFEEQGGLPDGALASPTKSKGRHFIFADPDRAFTNKAGLLKKTYGTDVRGNGGQIVAPGSMLDDGRSYGTRDDLIRFLRAYVAKSFPAVPDYISELIGAHSDSSPEGEQVTPSEEAKIIARLRDVDWPGFDDVFDGTLGKYDLAAILARDADLKAVWESDPSDCSAARFKLARGVMRECPDLQPEELAILFENCPAAGAMTDAKPMTGEYDLRQIAREWKKNTGLSKPSSGEAFGVVSDKDGGPESPEAERKTDYISLTDLLAEPETYTQWVVKHFIAFNTTIIAAGQWGSGKTAVYLDIALHIAHGLPWRSRKVSKGIVVYAALENPRDVQSRVRAWCKRKRNDVRFEDSFVLYRGNCSLFDPQNKPTKDEKRIIKLANDTAKKLGLPVAMIVIDTVSQAILPGSDREHGGLFVRSMQRIADATGASVTALHHPTKQGDEVRGDGAFQGNTDGVVLLSRDKKTNLGTIKASAQKFRVGDPRKVAFGYKLEPVIVGKDEDGEDIGVVVAVETADVSWHVDEEADDGQNVPPPPDTPSDRPAAILGVIRERVEMIAANTGETVDTIALQAGDVLKRWNDHRKRCGLPEITDPAVCSRLLGRLVEAGELVRVGENKRSTTYRLAGKP
jgi:hypothetical protein